MNINENVTNEVNMIIYRLQPKTIITSPLLYGLYHHWYTPVIQFEQSFQPMVLYENYLLCIFMNVDENFKNWGRIPLVKLVPGVTGVFGPTLNTSENFFCIPICSMQPLKCKNIVLNNTFHFDYVKFHGFNGKEWGLHITILISQQ